MLARAVLTCIGQDGYYARLVFWFCVPPVLIVVVIIGSVVAVGRRPRASAREYAGLLFASAAPPILRGLFLVYPLIANAAFEAFSCHDFDGSPLIVDVRIACYTDEYYSGVFTLAIAAVSFWAFGLVIVNGLFLFCARKALLQRRRTMLTHALGFLHAEYDPAFFWWELVEMLRRLLLVGIFVLFQRGSITQLFIATTFTAFYALIQVQVNPYNDHYANFLATCCSFFLLGVFLACIVMEIGSMTELPLVQDIMTTEQRSDLYVPAVTLTLAILLCCIGSLVLLLWVTGRRLRIERAKQLQEMESLTGGSVLRHRKTGTLVALPTIVEDEHHFFLSHQWSRGGQDVMRVLKQRLLVMLPGVRVWLDVDDLANVSDIPKLISKTNVVVVFCTERYFESKACMLELLAATHHGVKVIALLESDMKHGAFSVAQDVSVRLIAERLVGLPDQTYTNSDLTYHPLRPPPPPKGDHLYHIYCSNRNPGGAALVAEMANAHALQLSMAENAAAEIEASISTSTVQSMRREIFVKAAKRGELLATSSFSDMPRCDHMLLYLNGQTWTRGDEESAALADEVLAAMDAGVHILLAHEDGRGRTQDIGVDSKAAERHGVEFDTFFEVTPQVLLERREPSLYSEVAVALRSGPWRPVSMVHLGQALGMASEVVSELQELQRKSASRWRRGSRQSTMRVSIRPNRQSGCQTLERTAYPGLDEETARSLNADVTIRRAPPDVVAERGPADKNLRTMGEVDGEQLAALEGAIVVESFDF